MANRSMDNYRGGRRSSGMLSPFEPFNLFNEFLGQTMPDLFQNQSIAMATDVNESDNGYMISIDLPGIKRNDIDIDVQGNTLTITAERRQEISNFPQLQGRQGQQERLKGQAEERRQEGREQGRSMQTQPQSQGMQQDRAGRTFFSERSYGSFQRSFLLPEGVDTAHIEANYDDGVLQIFIPKSEQARRQKVTIGQGQSAARQGTINVEHGGQQGQQQAGQQQTRAS